MTTGNLHKTLDDKLFDAISILEEREKIKNRVDIRQIGNESLVNNLVKLVGRKPLTVL